jgi:hypothetical protein
LATGYPHPDREQFQAHQRGEAELPDGGPSDRVRLREAHLESVEGGEQVGDQSDDDQ